MDVINAVQIFMLLWSFTAVCQGDTGNCNVRCDDVTGTVGNEVIFTCSVSKQMTVGCVTLYKFQYPEKYNRSDIFKEEFPNDTCENEKTFRWRYTPDTAMKETFRFFVQAKGCKETKRFTVEISEPVKAEAPGITGNEPHKDDPEDLGHGKSNVSSICAGVGSCFIFIIILTIIIICQKHLGGCQERTCQVIRQKDDDNNIENV